MGEIYVGCNCGCDLELLSVLDALTLLLLAVEVYESLQMLDHAAIDLLGH
jgi:hypothetical protein